MKSKTIFQGVLACALLCSTLGISACSLDRAYTGPSRSADEVAVIRAHGTRFERVNGISVSHFASGAEVLPGPVTVEIQIEPANFNARTDHNSYTIQMNAEAGMEYLITGQRGIGKLCAWEVKKDTGRTDFSKPVGCISKQ